jgi:hypothetical protein
MRCGQYNVPLTDKSSKKKRQEENLLAVSVFSFSAVSGYTSKFS